MPEKGSAFSPFDVKLLLIGNSTVGKTGLLLRFSNNEWSPGGIATIGVDIRRRRMEINGKYVNIWLWDTAGQERFRSVTSGLYRKAQGVILVYDVTSKESFNALSGWLNELEERASDSVIKIIVGNKVDRRYTERQVTTAEGAAFAEQMGCFFVEASAVTGVGVQEAFTELASRILNGPEFRAEDLTPTISRSGVDDETWSRVIILTVAPIDETPCCCT